MITCRSRVIAEDRYTITLHLPQGFQAKRATFDGQSATITHDGPSARVSFLPAQTDSVGWNIEFTRD